MSEFFSFVLLKFQIGKLENKRVTLKQSPGRNGRKSHTNIWGRASQAKAEASANTMGQMARFVCLPLLLD